MYGKSRNLTGAVQHSRDTIDRGENVTTGFCCLRISSLRLDFKDFPFALKSCSTASFRVSYKRSLLIGHDKSLVSVRNNVLELLLEMLWSEGFRLVLV